MFRVSERSGWCLSVELLDAKITNNSNILFWWYERILKLKWMFSLSWILVSTLWLLKKKSRIHKQAKKRNESHYIIIVWMKSSSNAWIDILQFIYRYSRALFCNQTVQTINLQPTFTKIVIIKVYILLVQND